MQSFLLAADERAIDAALKRPLPTDDAIAALELHGPIVELGAGGAYWTALLRERGLTTCVCYDQSPSSTVTKVLQGGPESVVAHAEDHTLLLVRGALDLDEEAALLAYSEAGGNVVAYVGRPGMETSGSKFATALTRSRERSLSVLLPCGDRLTFWSRKPALAPTADGTSAPAAPTCGVLDVRLELVDLEAPEWAAPPTPNEGPFKPEIGSRTLNIKAQGNDKGIECD